VIRMLGGVGGAVSDDRPYPDIGSFSSPNLLYIRQNNAKPNGHAYTQNVCLLGSSMLFYAF